MSEELKRMARFLSQDRIVVANEVLSLEKQLAEAKARNTELEKRIQRAMNEVEGCDYDGQSGICVRVADILEGE